MTEIEAGDTSPGSDPENYVPILPIKDLEDFREAAAVTTLGDRRDGRLYRYTAPIKLAVNIALATGRPLLVFGPSGCGKSSLAFNLARVMKRRYYDFVVTSRAQARDLFYRFDAIRRLGDAHVTITDASDAATSAAKEQRSYFPYIDPGPLWWILDPDSARRRGHPGAGKLPFAEGANPVRWEPGRKDGEPLPSAVLLIDEIDKAEPDFPNNLLVPLGSRQFVLEEVSRPIELPRPDAASWKETPLVIITSNRERELPDAFIRRCVVLEIAPPDPDTLVEIAKAELGAAGNDLYQRVAARMVDLRGKERLSTAEFMDAVHAIQGLQAKEPSLSSIVLGTTWRTLEG